jgi:hypothetical protein
MFPQGKFFRDVIHSSFAFGHFSPLTCCFCLWTLLLVTFLLLRWTFLPLPMAIFLTVHFRQSIIVPGRLPYFWVFEFERLRFSLEKNYVSVIEFCRFFTIQNFLQLVHIAGIGPSSLFHRKLMSRRRRRMISSTIPWLLLLLTPTGVST